MRDSLTGADMRISVIVPFWNSEQWLGRCLDSLLNQDGDLEFVLVDDHSTDKSRDIAYDFCFKDPRFILLTNHRTKGVSGARNTGIEIADGEWLTFLDADDEMCEGAYMHFIRAIAQDKGANMHQFNHLRHYARNGLTVKKYDNGGGDYNIDKMPLMWFGVWNKLYRAEFIKDIRFDEGIDYGEDGLFNLECLAVDGHLHHANRDITTVIHHFDNPESLSHIKQPTDIIKQAHAYEDLAMRLTDVKMRGFICDELSRLWGQGFKRVFTCG